jgi:endonuclease/exonuclease/phosphatase (EEP) superfamily protein YafD
MIKNFYWHIIVVQIKVYHNSFRHSLMKSLFEQFFSKVLYIAVCFTFLLIGLSTVSHMHWVFDLISNFILQYAVCLIGLGVVLFFMKKWLIASMSSLIGGVIVVFIITYFNGEKPIAGKPKLKLASINVLSSNFDSSALYSYLDHFEPDVFYILEFTPFWLQAIQTKYSEQYPYTESQAQWDNFGIGLFSKYELKDVELFDFTQSYFPIVSATIGIEDKSIRLLGSHFENPMGAMNSKVRNYQIDRTIEYLADYENVVLVGDFNLTSYSYKFRDILNRLNLIDSRKGFGLGASWPTYFWPLMIPIDHCLISPELKVVNRLIGPSVQSDHLPLYVELTW